MKVRRASMLISTAFAVFLVAMPASAQIVGGSPVVGNVFPFGADIPRYQQVYDASIWTGPISILQISFFSTLSSGGILAGSYDFFLSTTGASVNALSTDLGANVGTDNSLFGSYTLSGTATGEVVFFGELGLHVQPNGRESAARNPPDQLNNGVGGF